MTPREKFKADEKKLQIYIMRCAVCEVCGKAILFSEAQLAHRIAKSKPNLKEYGKEIIHHPKNLVLTCGDKMGRCNDSVNIGNNPMAVAELVERIREDL